MEDIVYNKKNISYVKEIKRNRVFLYTDGKDKYILKFEDNDIINFDHPNIIKYLDINYMNDKQYILIKHYPKTLYDTIHEDISEKQFDIILKGILSGITYLYNEGYYHGDLHDENIMLDENFNPVIIDLDLHERDRRDNPIKLLTTMLFISYVTQINEKTFINLLESYYNLTKNTDGVDKLMNRRDFDHNKLINYDLPYISTKILDMAEQPEMAILKKYINILLEKLK